MAPRKWSKVPARELLPGPSGWSEPGFVFGSVGSLVCFTPERAPPATEPNGASVVTGGSQRGGRAFCFNDSTNIICIFRSQRSSFASPTGTGSISGVEASTFIGTDSTVDCENARQGMYRRQGAGGQILHFLHLHHTVTSVRKVPSWVDGKH